jgi:cytochrome oxidase Cu insertion factor (SCO1/SenC/PrrC family)
MRRLLAFAVLSALAAAPAALAHKDHPPGTPADAAKPAVEAVKRPAAPRTAAEREAKGREYFTDTVLASSDGRKLRFYSDVLKERVVLVNFIYTSCADACPMITNNLVKAKGELGEAFGRDMRFVSISIDPGKDTPEALAKFAAKLDATHPEWLFLTGAKADVDRIAKKMGAFSADPKEHFTGMYVGNLRTDRWRKVRPDAPPAVVAATLREIALPPEQSALR